MNPVQRVTVVTPSFNQAAYLEQTIQSVLSQDYPTIEYLVVDGGSTDGSVEIIRKYADRLAWWVSEKDHGQAEAINKGMNRASGEIVAWLNSDDLYLPGAVSAAVQCLDAHPECSAVFGDLLAIDERGEKINVQHFGDWGLPELMRFQIIGQPSVFMRRSVYQQVGGLDESYHFLLDHHLWLRLAQVVPLVYSGQLWAAARFHSGAKNVSQPVCFAEEAYRLAAWMPQQPGLLPLYRKNRRQVWAGAHRMNGFYLLDGGQPGPALRAYLKSLWCAPSIALKEWRRILFAAASLVVNVDNLRKRYLQRRKHRLAQQR
jgi:glycosyltransferase involved in cell wall biosynthesis